MNLAACILVGVLLLSGCDGTLNKDYRFEPQEQDLGWGVLYARLWGKDHTLNGGESYRGSPYRLTVSFTADSEKANGCELILDEVLLISVDDRAVALDKTASNASFKRGSSSTFKAYFSFKEIDLKYVAHELVVNYHTSGECPLDVGPSSAEATFSKDYEERKLTFWDALMGI